MIDLAKVKENTFYRGRVMFHSKEQDIVATFRISETAIIAYLVFVDGATGVSEAPEFLELEEIHQHPKVVGHIHLGQSGYISPPRPLTAEQVEKFERLLEDSEVDQVPEELPTGGYLHTVTRRFGQSHYAQMAQEAQERGREFHEHIDNLLKFEKRDRLELTIPEQFNNLGILKEEGFQYLVAEALQEGKHPLRIPLPYGGELGWFISDRDEKDNLVILRRKKFKIEALKI